MSSLPPTTAPAAHQVTCAKCGQTTTGARKFCGSCGARLWEPCLGCGASNSVAERFCSQCGADLQESLESAIKTLEARLARAVQLEHDGQLLAAAECLAELPESTHSQLAPRVQAAAERRSELVAKREQAIERRRAIVEEVLRLRERRQYAAAHALLQQVPASLRDQPGRTLLDELAELVGRIEKLRSALRGGLKEGQSDELLPLAEELLALEPQADDLRRLYDKLRERRDARDALLAERLLKQARDSIVRNGYRRAEECLSQLPAAAVGKLNDEQRKQLAAIEERVWLARQMRIAPYADDTLLSVAARLVKLQPRDDQARLWYQELSERLVKAASRAVPVAVAWAKSTGGGRLGAPVEPMTALGALQWDAANASLKSWPSGLRRHLVGVGLALHGLGVASLALELTLKGSGSWLQRLAVSPRNRSRPAAWGLDFGTSGLKVVRLSRDKDAVHVATASILKYGDQPGGQCEGSSDVRPHFATAMRRFLEQYQPAGEPLVVGFPGAQTLGRFFSLPESAGKKFQAALEFEVPNQIPLPLDQVVYAAHVWNEGGAGALQRHVAIVAAKRPHVELRLAPFAEFKTRVGQLQSDCVALANVLLYCQQGAFDRLRPDKAVALVDVGNSATNIVAVSPRTGVWFRTIYRGARSLNKSLVEALGVTWDQADQLRQQWNGARPMYEVDRALAPGIEELTREVQLALKSYRDANECQIERIFVAGGGSDQFGLLREWSQCGESPPPSSRRRRSSDAAKAQLQAEGA